ncbi:uncharacterized protein LOC127136699 [Lathyrus oleraceus]|uniref:uncharacterized protein LOC127136699 n=1 Tax=Pisum sativum TaxID=3888 RepID=UPI0021CFDC76|nr:uncharacterized protein LOC127136699 [Pisum sativum]
MACADAQKVLYDTHMLLEEAEYWLDNARQRFEANGIALTWVIFRDAFLEKYFSVDVSSKKEIEFVELKQGNMTLADYASKFEELSRFFPHYNGVEAEMSKCIKFENGLHLEIKQFIGYQEIRQFSVLVNKCHIYDKDIRVRSAHYKSVSEKKNGNQSRGKPEMAGRNYRTIVDALATLAQVLQAQQNPVVEDVESRGLDRIQRNKPPTFKGRYDPEGA